MTIATSIENAQQKVAAAYTAVSNKGGTLPATRNLANLPSAITSISGGGGGSTINNQDKTITVNGSYTADAGYTGLGTVTVNVDTVNNTPLSITPSTSSQSFTASSPYTGDGTVTVNAVTSSIDSNIQAENIKNGVSILGVSGTYAAGGTIDSLSITPTTSQQTITASGGVDGYSPMTVNAVTSSIDSNIKAENIKNGVSILGVSGTYTGSGGSSTKYGVSIDNTLGSVDSDGVLQMPDNTAGDIVFTGVKDVSNYVLYYKFNRNSNLACSVSFPDLETIRGTLALCHSFFLTHITSVSLPKLKTVSGNNAANYAFSNSNITSLSFPELVTVSGSSALQYLAADCSYLTSVSFPKLKTVSGGYGISYLAQNTKITTISFPELETASANYALQGLCSGCGLLETAYFEKLSAVASSYIFSNAFGSCKLITDIYFKALTTTSFGTSTNQFNGMFNGGSSSGTAATSGNVNVHFPSNLETTISGLTGYPLFGAARGRVTLLFDLPATS